MLNVYYKFLSRLIVNVTVLLYYYVIVLLYRYYVFVLDLFHILWCQPVPDLWNVYKFNLIKFNDNDHIGQNMECDMIWIHFKRNSFLIVVQKEVLLLNINAVV
jgi:hypothetical protein